MDWTYPIILVSSGLLVASMFTSIIAFRFGAPLLLIFLLVGLAAGEDGLGLAFDDAQTAYFIGSVALAIILFDSGFGTSWNSFRSAAWPAVTLATLGVALTAMGLGAVAHFVLGMDWISALLLGAIVGSTDAAAVFFLLRVGRVSIRPKVQSTLEVESGSNDPMAIFLTLTFISLATTGFTAVEAVLDLVVGFLMQMGVGLLFGLGGGFLIKQVGTRIEFARPVYPLVVLGLALCLFAITGLVGGSGFLACYVAGLYAGNSGMRGGEGLRRFQDGMTWLAQIVMFLILGLYATPSQFLAVLPGALLLALVLTFVARPLAVWICLLPFGFKLRETAFAGWVGLRGAVSILLAMLPIIAGLDPDRTMFNTVFIIVLASLIVQGWTIRPAALMAHVVVPERIGPLERVALELPGTPHHELAVYRIKADSPVLTGERIPRWARPSLVIRAGRSMRFQEAGRLQPGDYVYIFVSPRHVGLLDRLFASSARLDISDPALVGAIDVDPSQPIGWLEEEFRISVPGDLRDVAIKDFIKSRLGGSAERGDRVTCGPLDLVVRTVDEAGNATEVGLAVPDGDGTQPDNGLLARLAARAKRTLRGGTDGRT